MGEIADALRKAQATNDRSDKPSKAPESERVQGDISQALLRMDAENSQRSPALEQPASSQGASTSLADRMAQGQQSEVAPATPSAPDVAM